MANYVKSFSSDTRGCSEQAGAAGSVGTGASAGWLKVGAIAAGSAILGGLAAAWFYRKTLMQLREAGHGIPDSSPQITKNETEEDF